MQDELFRHWCRTPGSADGNCLLHVSSSIVFDSDRGIFHRKTLRKLRNLRIHQQLIKHAWCQIPLQTFMRTPLFTILTATGLLLAPVVLSEAALAQRVVEINPADDSRNVAPDTSISGQFDAGNGPAVDLNSVRISVNGRDVTNRSTITRNFFTYRPDQALPPGNVDVRVDYNNANGDRRSASWNFTVQQPQTAVQINAINHNAANAPLGPGATFTATINGTPNAQASILLIQDGRTVREIPAQEVGTGVYVATLTLGNADRVNEGIVVGRLTRQSQTTYAAATRPAVFSASGRGSTEAPQTGSGLTGGTPGGTTNTVTDLKPRFTSHEDGDEVSGRSFTLEGRTLPNATVSVTVTSRVSVLGISVSNETLVNNQQITADRNGEFEVTVPALRIPVPGTRYTVRATARSNNQTSQETQITLVQD